MANGKPSEGTYYHKGRGAQYNTGNRFLKHSVGKMHVEAIDDWEHENPATVFLEENAKALVNKVDSPDVGMLYSMNPYQGCEHGCIYCYARNSFEYWGWSAGIDFETKIIVKKNAPLLLSNFLMNPNWHCVPIALSGNTDCYQPAEKKFQISRQLLQVASRFNQPISIITKNAGLLRDMDILVPMAQKNLVSVMVSITSLNEALRRVMEPRTTTAQQRLRLIEELSKAGVPTGVMAAPMIPGLNDHELHDILKAAASAGAINAGYTFVRLNGAIQFLFHDWLFKNFPDRANKVWHLIESGHGGKVNDSEWSRRMKGDGNIAAMIAMQFKQFKKRFGYKSGGFDLDCSKFQRPGSQITLF